MKEIFNATILLSSFVFLNISYQYVSPPPVIDKHIIVQLGPRSKQSPSLKVGTKDER